MDATFVTRTCEIARPVTRAVVRGARAVAWLWLLITPALAAGFQKVTVPDPDVTPLEVGIWYPSNATGSARPLEEFAQTVAENGEVDGSGLPLILISHGSGGSLASHYDTALALANAGFVVAAVTHTGDNSKDQSKFTEVTERPRQLQLVLDYMLKVWPAHDRINPAKVGVFGFADGGFAALILLGGEPDMTSVGPYCGAFPDDSFCHGLKDRHLNAGSYLPHGAWVHDSRVRAAVVASPAFGYAYPVTTLANMFAPIQLWRAAQDEIAPNPNYAQAVYDGLLVKPDYHVVPNAGHFVFTAPCPSELASAEAAICQDRPGFDRVAFHETFNAAVVSFFGAKLSVRCENGSPQRSTDWPPPCR